MAYWVKPRDHHLAHVVAFLAGVRGQLQVEHLVCHPLVVPVTAQVQVILHLHRHPQDHAGRQAQTGLLHLTVWEERTKCQILLKEAVPQSNIQNLAQVGAQDQKPTRGLVADQHLKRQHWGLQFCFLSGSPDSSAFK